MPATPLPPLPAPASPEPSAAAGGDERSSDRRGLAIFLRQTRAFRLALALYNDPANRDAEIRSLSDELAGQGVRVLTLDLRIPDPEGTLSGRVRALVDTGGVSPGERLAIMVVNLETRVDYAPELAQPGGPGTAFLETANLHRELFPEACPGPVVVWMTELLERAFVRHAPDLWHWRSHVFDLRTRVVSREAADFADKNAWSSDDNRRHPEDRLRRLEEELVGYRQANQAFDEGRALNAMGLARLDAGDARSSLHDFEKALVIARNLGNRNAEGAALGNLGSAYGRLGEARRAIEFHEQALVIARATGDRRGEGSELGSLGNACTDLGETRRAIEFYEQGLGISREIGDQRGEGTALGNLGRAYARLGEPRQSIEFYEQTLVIARATGDRHGESHTLGNLGAAYAALGETRRAIEFYEQGLRIAREIGARRGESIALWNSALAFDALGDRVTAIGRAERALSLKEAIEDPWADKVRARLAEWRGQIG